MPMYSPGTMKELSVLLNLSLFFFNLKPLPDLKVTGRFSGKGFLKCDRNELFNGFLRRHTFLSHLSKMITSLFSEKIFFVKSKLNSKVTNNEKSYFYTHNLF